MARPAKNNADYFSHDAGMRNHRKIKAVRNRFGVTGYAIWNMLLEHLTALDGNKFDRSDSEFELIAGDFGVSVTEIRDVIDFCIRLELLFEENGVISSKSLNERLAPVYNKRDKAKQLLKKQCRDTGKYVSRNADPLGVSVTEMPQSKVKEIKVNTHLHECVCEIFGREYQKPPDRMPALANWYKTIEQQAEKLLEAWPEDVAIRQVKAYMKHCDATNRKRIGLPYKVADTLMSADWIGLSAPDPVPKNKNQFEEAEYNLTLWTREAWLKHYEQKIRADPKFREHFKTIIPP